MSQDHLLAISTRRRLSEKVTDALVEYGDNRVACSTANNKGAQFSDLGYTRLIEKAEGNDRLAMCIALRPSVPRHHLLKLLAKASDAVRVKLQATFEDIYHLTQPTFVAGASAILVNFLIDRLKVQQREAGVRHDLIDAVFACQNEEGGNEDDLVRLLARVNALQAFIRTEDGANLLAAYKRAANILKKEDWKGGANEPGTEIARTGEEDPLALVDDPDLRPVVEARLAEKKKLSYTPEPAEKALIEALDSAEPKAAAAVQAEDFEAAMAALASLRAPIDKFFDEVTVNDADPAKRSARLDLLGRFRAAVHEVADFSKIEG